ncbi:MAG: HD family hydrolase [Asgard group archaeon]|nr:HD family hydrolase [Asgard group archaeon]
MIDNINNFLQNAIRLKKMVRSGWLYSGVSKSDVESVADHSYMVSLLSLIIALSKQEKGEKINLEKVLIMALLHDLPESVSQDIDRRIRKFSPEKYDAFKKELDVNAFESLINELPTNLVDKLSPYYQELIEGKSQEARIVIEVDRLEILIQLQQYRQTGLNKNLFKEFYDAFNMEKNSYQIDLVKKLAKFYLE